jgi:hypothetical protein
MASNRQRLRRQQRELVSGGAIDLREIASSTNRPQIPREPSLQEASQFLHLTSHPYQNTRSKSEHIEGRGMRSVTVRVQAEDLAREMVVMRSWLDRHRYEPTRFDCNQNGKQIILSVDFTTDATAEAFAQCFNGECAQQLLHRDSSRRAAT